MHALPSCVQSSTVTTHLFNSWRKGNKNMRSAIFSEKSYHETFPRMKAANYKQGFSAN